MTPYSGRFYRILFRERVGDALNTVYHPEGRFHHSGQNAIYVSATRQGAQVAIDSYYQVNDPPRELVPLWLESARLLDFRHPATSRIRSFRR